MTQFYVLRNKQLRGDVYFVTHRQGLQCWTGNINEACKFDKETADQVIEWHGSDWEPVPVVVEKPVVVAPEPVRQPVYEQLTKDELLLLLIYAGTPGLPDLNRTIELLTENVILQDNLQEVMDKVVTLSGPF